MVSSSYTINHMWFKKPQTTLNEITLKVIK
nr:MAG TPA_asm: hypothetical protein [Caudoviricetes sp.]